MMSTDVLESHQMVNEEHTFALEQLPHRLASFALQFADLR